VPPAAHVPLQRHRFAADRQDDLQVGRIEPESQALADDPGAQAEVEELALDVVVPVVELAMANADPVDHEGRAEAVAAGLAFQQFLVEHENRPVDLDADGLFFHEQRGGRQVDIDARERDHIFAANGKILDIADFQPQGEKGEAHVAEVGLDPAVGDDQVVYVILSPVIGSGE
jgi:hypothetical protein